MTLTLFKSCDIIDKMVGKNTEENKVLKSYLAVRVNTVWLNLLILALILHIANASDCVKTGPCTCKASHGEVDLLEISIPVTGQGYSMKASSTGYTYYYNPCTKFTYPPAGASSCTDVAVCQENGNKDTYNAGVHDGNKFTGSPDDDTLKITYTDGVNPPDRQSEVSFKCDSSVDKVFTVTQESFESSELSIYKFEVKTKLVCPPGISAGSVLCILLVVAIVVYFVGGCLFLRCVRGAQGVEAVPNHEFWKDFPFLVRDGTCFLVKGCKTEDTYDSI